jgi:hypothetical protein
MMMEYSNVVSSVTVCVSSMMKGYDARRRVAQYYYCNHCRRLVKSCEEYFCHFKKKTLTAPDFFRKSCRMEVLN